jgi:3'-5' exonuclease
MAALVFSVVCVPDIVGIRRLHALPDDLADDEVTEFAWQCGRGKGYGDALAACQQRIVSIGCAQSTDGLFSLCSFSGEESTLLRRFYALACTVDTLIEWDAPGAPGLSSLHILQSRAVLHQIAARICITPQNLGDAFGGASACASKPLPVSDLAQMICLAGLPTHQTPDPLRLWQAFSAGDLGYIETFNETRILGQYVLWLRLRLLHGEISEPECLAEYAKLRQSLQNSSARHLQNWLAAWSALG